MMIVVLVVNKATYNPSLKLNSESYKIIRVSATLH